MRLYEGMFILRQSFVREDREKALGVVREIVEKFGGAVKKISVWAERSLAYEIDHVREASYILAYFEVDPSEVSRLERAVRIHDDLLRCLILVPPKDFDLENAQMTIKEKEEEPKRPGRYLGKKTAASDDEVGVDEIVPELEIDEKVVEEAL
ncbi:MAG: 30S ribosomal protein S6 [Planctomycetes bacterium]|nr:30S ribosomal protein S6 [Planctomycetota bacterium]